MLTVLWVCRPHGLREKRRGYKHARISGLLQVQNLVRDALFPPMEN